MFIIYLSCIKPFMIMMWWWCYCFCRLLEEGKLDEADAEKQRVEQLQREQRKKREEDNVEYLPMWFTWVALSVLS